MTSQALFAYFGISGSVADRAQTMLRAAGVDRRLTYGSVAVRDPSLLTSRRRRKIAEQRDLVLTTE